MLPTFEVTAAVKPLETEYINTDFDLESEHPFETLTKELTLSCYVLHYFQDDRSHWLARIESNCDHSLNKRDAATDILTIIKALNSLSEQAKKELAACYLREFNLGFNCGDAWAYSHQLPITVVQAVLSRLRYIP